MRKIKVVVLLVRQLQHGFTKNAKVSPNLTVTLIPTKNFYWEINFGYSETSIAYYYNYNIILNDSKCVIFFRVIMRYK